MKGSTFEQQPLSSPFVFFFSMNISMTVFAVNNSRNAGYPAQSLFSSPPSFQRYLHSRRQMIEMEKRHKTSPMEHFSEHRATVAGCPSNKQTRQRMERLSEKNGGRKSLFERMTLFLYMGECRSANTQARLAFRKRSGHESILS